MEGSIIRQVVEFFTALDFGAFEQVRASAVEQGALAVADTNRMVTTHDEVGRNDLCPCGSGKKYKKCGLLNTPEHQMFMSKK